MSGAGPDGPRTHPLANGAADPPPPRREQLPLPRRSRQHHLEPQLRQPGGAGDGTPFRAFAPSGPDAEPDRADPGLSRLGAIEPGRAELGTIEPSTVELTTVAGSPVGGRTDRGRTVEGRTVEGSTFEGSSAGGRTVEGGASRSTGEGGAFEDGRADTGPTGGSRGAGPAAFRDGTTRARRSRGRPAAGDRG